MASLTGKEIKLLVKQMLCTTLNFRHAPKSGEFTCWAGCYRMLENYHTKQPQKFKRFLALQNPTCKIQHCELTPCTSCDRRREKDNYLSDLIKLGYKQSVQLSAYANSGTITSYLQQKQPLMVYRDYGDDTGHVMIISGIVVKFPSASTLIVVNDPDKHKGELVDLVDFCMGNGNPWIDTWIAKK
ncbi:papain-like cysteine protease family protein [Herbaspirillum sp. SJZ107]|uniref:papain-like cysteine protease family protein n=1 Tax=Herbaspirillum sp. SJZ107 TaxID=2572881 RepID=UPI001153887C|nr:papain-like cysteine protease family protein [Herbaspirillum sp. SJZ107]